jgi:hypothetical protein
LTSARSVCLSGPTRPLLHDLERALFPALTLWTEDVRLGGRGQDPTMPTTWIHDALWKAGCWEANAREALENGALEWAEQCLQRSAGIVAQATQEAS